ncbi:hypothetical protein N7471_010620 [Penicillium samsonianum]|uniref:uncharacterized protein n=1 Tax=Penicillium samsonianum TaxID=1882272 RepID=UPI0025496810|nr:uncharacterized protein N7471_010620 [Penicillium samsonianum]KAJ6126127.1 hypothetical protein N7471_010620 [Penicillium samsonianum]
MSNHIDEYPMNEDSYTRTSDKANLQLDGELRQSGEVTRTTTEYSQRTIPVGISPAYVKGRDNTDVFRELYQNWKDAILERFQSNRLDFKPFFEDKKDHFSIIVPATSNDNGNRRALGFIKNEKKTGRVILINSCMQFSFEFLVMGLIFKDNDEQLLGSHGEGLKLAALIMSRYGYKVSVAASHCKWSFGLHGRYQSLRCVIVPSRKMRPAIQREPADDTAKLRFQDERDVTVVIGAGWANRSRPVSSETFFGWLYVTLDIRGLSYPSSIVETPQGDLLLDSQYHGRLFLHGVLLPISTSGIKHFKFRYNFTLGKFSRDRQKLIARCEVADKVRQIWQCALHMHEQTLLPIYVNLLQNFPQVGDMEQANRLLEASTKARSPIRTVGEEQAELFKNAEICASPESAFAKTTDWALGACLALSKATRNIQVLYVKELTQKLDVLYDAGHEELLYLSISSIFKASSTLWITEMTYMRQIRRLLRLLPHSIRLASYSGGLMVTWEHNEAESFRKLGGGGTDYRVVPMQRSVSSPGQNFSTRMQVSSPVYHPDP